MNTINTMNTNMNTTRPTPETDAVAWVVAFGYQHLNEDVDVVDAEFARRRERERDEAREHLALYREQCAAANKGAEINAHINHSLAAKLAEAKRERDEARALNGDMLKLMRRLHLAITARMSADNPTDEQRLELRLAWEEAGKFLEGFMPLTQPMNTITETP